MENNSREDIEWAIVRNYHTQRYCGEDCNNPHFLNFESQIDLDDGITVDGRPLLLTRNPYKLLKDRYINEWFNLCQLAQGGLFPVSGGAIDQPTEFLEFYQIYLSLKSIKKVEKEQP